jgi:cysteine desulfurase
LVIYLDYNATTPVAPEVLDTMLPWLREGYGNPSSAHAAGRRAHDAVEAARAQVAALIGASPGEIVFTSGGTEASNLAIRGFAQAHPDRRHIVTSSFEHPATAETCIALERQGWRVTRAPVEPDGRISPGAFARLLDADAGLATVMHANNEIGTVQPIAAFSALCRKNGTVMHTDAAQTAGKIPVNVDALGVDLLTIAGHKMYAPIGIGALFVRRGTKLEAVLSGAGHERGLRPGTENVAGIVALGKAAEIAQRDLDANQRRMSALREGLLGKLRAAVPGLVLHGHPAERLPNTLFVSFPGVPGERLLGAIPDLAASTGSACHAGSDSPCASLLAIGVATERAVGPVRLSLGRETTAADIDGAARRLASAWARLSR